jgi:YHS domain-containing protein
MTGGAPSIAKMKFKPYLPYPYPFAMDLVSGAQLGADAISFVQGDYEVKVANAADEDAIKKSPDAYVAKIKLAYQTAKPSPLTACPVCGMEIDESDLPFVYEGRQFQVCDASELAVFEKDPAQYVKMWDDAEKAMTAKK